MTLLPRARQGVAKAVEAKWVGPRAAVPIAVHPLHHLNALAVTSSSIVPKRPAGTTHSMSRDVEHMSRLLGSGLPVD